MARPLSVLLLAALPATALALDTEIAADTTLPAGVHRLDAPLRVVADGVTLDLGEAVLVGPRHEGDPDGFEGIGILVEGREGVVIRGGTLRGFRCAILVRDCRGVVVEDVDASGNFRQRLGSTPEREDVSDWLRPHDNDAQQWRRRYGAGICLERTRGATVRRCRGRDQQNGLLLDRCEETRVYDNDFSFNSGWGIALWRSSRNVVCRNRCDWCVRGYSHGVYARGQDSAGILVFEQCSDNVFARNSATHGGDGFFLYAGEDTLHRTGEGGSNRNLVANNDFSHAVANAIEATFSTANRFVGNRCDDSNYGLWLGYSRETLVEGNQIAGSTYAGVAIEHGQRNTIVFNTFTDNARAIRLWWDEDEELLATRFAAGTSCPSTGYLVARNLFEGDRVGVALERTSDVRLAGNHFEDVGTTLAVEGACPDVREVEPAEPLLGTKLDLELPGDADPFLPAGHPRGRRHVLVGRWGPLDPTRSDVYPRRVVAWEACTFRIVGPAAVYAVEGLPEGLVLEREASLFRVRAGAGGLVPFSASVVLGDRRFGIEGVLLRARWHVRHWSWTTDPREEGAFAALVATPPAAALVSPRLDYAWGAGAPDAEVGADRFATRAETTMRLPAGRYEVRTVSDDGVRVAIDGRTVLEDWTWHAPKEQRAFVDLEEGEHAIVVDHFELDGWAVLRFDLRPAR